MFPSKKTAPGEKNTNK